MKPTRAECARNLRYKKAALASISYYEMSNELYEISEECSNIQYFMSDDSTLLDAMDGDEDDAFEFQMLFCDLSGKCESLMNAVEESGVQENFDDFMVGMLGNRYKAVGYDSVEEDYFSLTRFEGELAKTESGKRLLRLKKEELLSVCGQCIGTAIAFLDVRQSYDYLKATFDILKDKNTSVLQNIKAVEAAYDEAATEGFIFYSPKTREFEQLILQLPERTWLE
jgi:hypothetical protein